MKRVAVVALFVLLAVTAAGVSIAAKLAPAQEPVLLPTNSVTICHATGDDPYTRESPNVSGVLNGHAKTIRETSSRPSITTGTLSGPELGRSGPGDLDLRLLSVAGADADPRVRRGGTGRQPGRALRLRELGW